MQIVRLFEKNVFGRTPRDGFETRADLLYAAEALEGTAKREFYRITVRTKRGSAAFHMALVLPNPQKPVPAVLMISNHEKTPAAVKGPDMSAFGGTDGARAERMADRCGTDDGRVPKGRGVHAAASGY